MRLRLPALSNRRVLFVGAGLTALLATVLTSQCASPSRERAVTLSGASADATHDKPPWIYGRPNARFQVVAYADLTCPYCRAYFPRLREWIDEHPDANWQWHHLPLPAHEPAAREAARLAECAGETGGNAAFWNAVAWLYEHPSGGTSGPPMLPEMSPAIQECLKSSRSDALIQAQASAAARDAIAATPTLRVVDQKTGKMLVLHGPVEGDALLSAIDLLVAQTDAAPNVPE